MNGQYSYTYKRGPEMTEAQIQQAGADAAEREAEAKAKAAEGNGVNFYRETYQDSSDEIITCCADCAATARSIGAHIEYIDRAGDWDECPCGKQNLPRH